jgi:3-phenylpropionate/trans-cinnamate dioxygenase ferredoxin component
MSGYSEVMKTDTLQNGEMRAFSVGGKEILVARVGDKFFAVGNRCPHLKAKLDTGKLTGTILTCPKHGSQFDLTDGHVVRWTNFPGMVSAMAKLVKPPKGLITYLVKVDATKVLVEV